MKEPFEINSPVENNIPLFVVQSKFKSCFPHLTSEISTVSEVFHILSEYDFPFLDCM